MPAITIGKVSISLLSHSNNSSNPRKDSGGPGSAGSRAPARPVQPAMKANMTIMYSIVPYLVNENLRLTPKSVVVVGYELDEMSGIVCLRSKKKLIFSI